MDNKELIDIACKGEWTLECDRKVLEMMQTLASKIETRAANTKGKMNEMVLSLDHTKVKMSNLTRINDIKNTVYCENLITDDHLEPITEVPKTTVNILLKVKLSTSIAIENGLKLMENSFEKHRVNLDPSDNQSKITTVYRPIDKFYTPLPFLIGEKNWKEKWHLGLIEEDRQSQTGSMYAESVESNLTSNSRVESDMLASESNLMASQTSLSKSSSSIGDQMIINKQGGLFDEIYTVDQTTPTNKQPTTSSFFAPQPSERKIVNLFDDEPPELSVESSHNRKPVNLFDDVDSVISMPIPETESFDKPLPPVDLFNDNEFDNFIKKMEHDPQKHVNEDLKSNSEIPTNKMETVKDEKKTNNMQRDIHKNIAAEIKNVHLRKAENVNRADNTVTKTVEHTQPEKKVVEKQASSKQEIKTIQESKLIKSEPKPQESRSTTDKTENKAIINVKPRQKITNLFDDDDDESEDFFDEIIKQKNQNIESKVPQVRKAEQIVQKTNTEKKKSINLFDDEEEDDFDNIFNKKLTESPIVSTPKIDNLVQSSKDSEKITRNTLKGYQTHNSSSEIPREAAFSNEKSQTTVKMSVNKQQKKIFDDDSDNDVNNLFETQSGKLPKLGQESAKLALKESESEQIKSDLSVRNVYENESTDAIKNSDKNDMESKMNINQSIEYENDLIKSKQSINANYSDDNENFVPNVSIEPESQNIASMSNRNEPAQTPADNSLSRTPEIKEFSNPVLFLSDEPPDYDDNWDTEENNFEEPEDREIFSRNTSNYLAFNDIPPDDDDDFSVPVQQTSFESSHIEDDFDDFLSEKSNVEEIIDKQESLPAITDQINEKTESSEKPNLELPKHIPIDIVKESLIDSNDASSDNLIVSQSIPEEKDHNMDKSSIKSKREIFTKPQESTTSSQQDSPPKKLPGKLSSSLKINVGALMPGARLPKKIQSPTEDNDRLLNQSHSVEELDSSLSSNKSTSVTENTSSIEKSSNSGLLNNDLTKMRAKIRVKRRPSTRKGRQSIYEKTLSVNIDEEENNEHESTEKNVEEKTQIDNDSDAGFEIKQTDVVSPNIMQQPSLSINEFSKNNIEQEVTVKNEIIESNSSDLKLSQSIDESNHDKITHDHKKVKVKPNILDFFDDEPPPFDSNIHVETKKTTTTTSRSRIYYDDEDETRKMLEEEKKKKNIMEVRANLNESLFDKGNENDHTVNVKNQVAENVNQIVKKELVDSSKKINASSLFDDDSDSDLFAATSKIVQKPKKVETVTKTEAPRPLFNDDLDDDDLFSTSKKKLPEKSTKLFDSDDDNTLDGSIIFSKSASSNKPKKQSIFGDDNSDNDDLFSSKPKNIVSTNPTSVRTTPSTVVKKSTSTVVNDPLKDLLQD